MKRLLSALIFAVFAILLIYACGNKNEYSHEDSMVMDSYIPQEEVIGEDWEKSKKMVAFGTPIVDNFLVTQAAAQDVTALKRPLIKTAKLKFKVRDVVNSSYAIEKSTLQNSGFILESKISSSEYFSTVMRTSADSSLIIRKYDITGDLVVRVPQENLHIFLEEIAKEATLVDYRLLNAKDLTIDLFANGLDQERLTKKSKRMGSAISSRSGKLEEAMDAEEALDAAEKYANEVKVSEYRMQDDMKLSTVTIEIYQDKVESRETIKYVEQIESYEPGVGSRLIDALVSGWNGLCSFFVSLINIWPLLLVFVFVGYLIYRKFRSNNKE
ncbi:DUF4349 domain-containing protein [Dysgonomonas massiliensis]|uniref:DUF4349 domain-containing protein n=1 Tax=Dysgonomonas massiliensis TaxID=2040292 RepID=UPI000C759BD0|nr:DUF4349 domain-containing protein [Dysgonomonas massiliensis]